MVDINADTFPELLVANGPGSQNKVYINPGSGDFSAVTPVGIGSDSESDDSRVVIVDTFGTQLAAVFANAGQANKKYNVPSDLSNFDIQSSSTIGTGDTDDTRSIAASLINDDSFMDIVATNAGVVTKQYINPGSGDFSLHTAQDVKHVGSGGEERAAYALALADIDSNGYLDIISNNEFYLNPGQGGSAGDFTGVEAKKFGSLNPDVKSVAAADLDSDGDQDVVFATSREVLVYLNPTGSMDRFMSGSLSSFFDNVNPTVEISSTTELRHITLADLNGDSRPDLLVSTASGGQSAFYINNGNSGFYQGGVIGGREDTRFMYVADMNQDGAMDILVANNGEASTLHFGDVTAFAYSIASSIAIDTGATQSDAHYTLGVGDMDSDGVQDVVVGNFAGLISFDPTPPHPIPYHTVLSRPAQLQPIPPRTISAHPTPLHPIPPHPMLLSPTAPTTYRYHPKPPHSTRPHLSPPHPSCTHSVPTPSHPIQSNCSPYYYFSCPCRTLPYPAPLHHSNKQNFLRELGRQHLHLP